MEVLGIGMSELVFVVIIALVLLGPKDMQKAGKTIGKFLRSIISSDGWKIFQQTSRELRSLPNRLMREAGDEVNQIGNQVRNELNNSGSNPTSNRPPGPPAPPASRPYSSDSAPGTSMTSKPEAPPQQTKADESDPHQDA